MHVAPVIMPYVWHESVADIFDNCALRSFSFFLIQVFLDSSFSDKRSALTLRPPDGLSTVFRYYADFIH